MDPKQDTQSIEKRLKKLESVIQFTDSGVTLTYGGTTIELRQYDIRIRASNLDVRMSANVSIKAGNTGDLQSSGPMTIRGSQVNVN